MATPNIHQICASYVLAGIETISAPNGGSARVISALLPSLGVKSVSRLPGVMGEMLNAASRQTGQGSPSGAPRRVVNDGLPGESRIAAQRIIYDTSGARRGRPAVSAGRRPRFRRVYATRAQSAMTWHLADYEASQRRWTC
jgi:hypothetical protein